MSSKNNVFHYYVEGECEGKLINTYKKPPYSYFVPGKVEILNVVQKEISRPRITALKANTIVIFVYDTDVENDEMIQRNVSKLKKYGFRVYHIQSVKKFEDEIVYASRVKSVLDVFKTDNEAEFKNHFILQSNLPSKLLKVGFEIEKPWIRNVDEKSVFFKYYSSSSRKMIKASKPGYNKK